MAVLKNNIARAVAVFKSLKETLSKYDVAYPMEDISDKTTDMEQYVEGIDRACSSEYLKGLTNGNETGWNSGHTQGIEEGRQAQYDEFAEYFCTAGDRSLGLWTRAFACNVNYFPYLRGRTIQPLGAYQMFYGLANSLTGDLQQKLDEYNVILDFSKCKTFQYCFANTNLTRIGVVDTSSATTISQLFFSSSKLITVDKLIPNEAQAYAPYAFQGCSALKNIMIEGTFGKDVNCKDCPLSKESILSIFNALSPTAEGMTVTFKKIAVNTAFGINVDDETSYTDEWKSLTESKKNWNIAYA